MATEIMMPQMGADMTEGVIASWLKAEGDSVQKGDAIAEIETEKTTIQIEAFASGVLGKIVAQPGAKVPVGEIIGYITAPGEAAPTATAPAQEQPSAAPASAAPVPEAPVPEAPVPEAPATVQASSVEVAPPPTATATPPLAPAPAPAPAAATAPKPVSNEAANATPVARRVADEMGVDLSQVKGSGPDGQITRADVEAFASTQASVQAAPAAAAQPATGRIIATPVAKKVAQERGVDLRMVKGSGPEGRITLADVESYAEKAPAAAPTPTPAPAPVPAAAPAPAAQPTAGRKPLTRIRQTIAQRMTQSKTTIPHFYITVAVDMDAALKLREQINEALKPENIKVSVNDLVIRATALALKRFPNLNASFAGDAIELREQVHIGVAVALEAGLVTVTVRDADTKTLRQIALDMGGLATRAREGKAQLGDMGGQTFTISNLGMYGVESFVAIVNPPDAGILAIGAAIPTPVVRDGEVVVRNIMHITLSGDHRVTDGAEGAQFANEVKRILENPWGLVL